MSENPPGEIRRPPSRAVDFGLALLTLAFWLVVYSQKGRWHEGAMATALAGGALALAGRQAFAAGGRWKVALGAIWILTLASAVMPPRVMEVNAGSIGSVPRQLPGPADTWASKEGPREISVPLAGGSSALVRLNLLESHDTLPPRLQVVAGDCDLGIIHVKRGGGSPPSRWQEQGRKSSYTIMVPAKCLDKERNQVALRPVEGSWIAIKNMVINPLPAPWELWRFIISPWNWLLFWISSGMVAARMIWGDGEGPGKRALVMHAGLGGVVLLGLMGVLTALAVYVEARAPWMTTTQDSWLPREMYGNGKFIHDQSLGWRLLPNHVALTQRSPDHEPEVFYVNNKQGFRALGTEMDFPSKGKAMLLGDSFCQGEFLSQEQTIASRMSSRLGGYVYNFGVLGYSTDQEYTVFMEWIHKVEVEWVALLFFPNDVMFIDQNQGHGFDKPWYEINDGRVDFARFHPLPREYVKAENAPILARSGPQAVYCCHTPRDVSVASRAMKKAAGYILGLYYPGRLGAQIVSDVKMTKIKMSSTHSDVSAELLENPEAYRPQFTAVFDFIARMNQVSVKRGIKFLAVFIPDIIQIYHPENPKLGNFRDMFMGMCAQNGLPCLDASGKLMEKTKLNDTYFIDDGHLSPFGAQVVGALISDEIEKR